MLAKHKHKVLFSPIHSATYDVQHVKLHGGEGNVSIQTSRDQMHALLSWERIMHMNYHYSYHKGSVLRETLHMTVLVDRPSLAVDELLLIVTYTIMLSDFYTPSETMLCLCVYRILVYAQT